jgi:hypothetical protein
MVMRIDILRGGGTVALVGDAVASEHLSHRVRHGQVWWRAARRASVLLAPMADPQPPSAPILGREWGHAGKTKRNHVDRS